MSSFFNYGNNVTGIINIITISSSIGNKTRCILLKQEEKKKHLYAILKGVVSIDVNLSFI